MLSIPFFSPSSGANETKKRNVVAYSLASEVPYEEIVNNNMIYSDGSMGACWRFEPIYCDSMGDMQRKQAFNAFFSMINTLPMGTYAQFLWRKDNYVPILDAHKAQIQVGDPVVHSMTDDRIAHWKQKVASNQTFGLTTYLWLRKMYARAIRKPLNYLVWRSVLSGKIGVTGSREIKEYIKEHFEIEDNFRVVSEQIISPLRNITSVQKCDANETLGVLWRFFTGNSHPPKYSTNVPIRSYFGGWDMSRKWGYMTQGNTEDRIISMVSVDMFPGTSIFSLINTILTCPIPLTISMNIAPVSMESAKTYLRKRMRRYETLLFKLDPEAEERLKEFDEVLRTIDSTNNLLFDTEMFIMIEGKTLDELNERRNKFLSTARSYDFTVNPEKAALPLVYKAAMPGACVVGTTDREIRVKTENIADLAPIFGPIQSAAKPIMLMLAPYTTVFGYDLFDSRLPAYHGLIMGATGAGKSFTMNLMILSAISQNPQIFIVDKGGSYRKITSVLGGSYVDTTIKDINEVQDVSFNPLAPKSEWRNRRSAIELILREMCMVDENDGFGCAIIERLVVELFQAFEKEPDEPTLSDAYRFLSKYRLYDQEQETQLNEKQNEIRINLGRWTHIASRGNSPSARLLDNPRTTVSLENDMVTFDMLGIQGDEKLTNVMFYILADLVKRKVMKDAQRHKIIVFDEAWSVLKTKSGADFLEDLYKTMRKYNAMILSISQSVDDFSNSDVAAALIGQTTQTFILRQNNTADAENIQRILRLNDGERNIIETLERQKGRYSEVFLKLSGIGSSRLAIYPSPVEYWLATTDPKDIEVYNNYVERQGYGMQEAILELASKYPNGIL